jgi:hypothetical protein
MFIHKDNFEPIPKELCHHFGDSFLYEILKKKNKINYYLHNWVMISPMRVTTAVVKEVHQKILNDWEIATEVFARYGIHIDISNARPALN